MLIPLETGMDERIIGLTIVAAGTSLPELVTSTVAAIKGNSDLALGNIIGSNIFNLLFILSISGIIHPIPFKEAYSFDFALYIVSSLLVLIFMFTGRRRKIDRWEGILFFVIFAVYMIYII